MRNGLAGMKTVLRRLRFFTRHAVGAGRAVNHTSVSGGVFVTSVRDATATARMRASRRTAKSPSRKAPLPAAAAAARRAGGRQRSVHASAGEPGGAVLWRYRSRAAVASASPATTQSGAPTTLAPGAARQPPPKAASASAASRSRSSRHLRFFNFVLRRGRILAPPVARRLFHTLRN